MSTKPIKIEFKGGSKNGQVILVREFIDAVTVVEDLLKLKVKDWARDKVCFDKDDYFGYQRKGVLAEISRCE